MTESDKIQILLVDDHAMVREGLRAFLSFAPDIKIVGEASSGAQALSLLESVTPQVILMDLVMPGELNGIEATRIITCDYPLVNVVALTSFQDEDRVLDAIDAGAIGYLRKDVSPDDLLSAIRQAAAGRTVLEATAMRALTRSRLNNAATHPDSPLPTPSSQTVTNLSQMELGKLHDSSGHLEPAGPIEELTKRELEILQCLARGLANKQIGVQLGITEKTVKVHVSHILGKLGAYDRTQAVIIASRIGLVQL